MIAKSIPLFLALFMFICLCFDIPNVNALVDKTGQEVIEVRNPLKDLPGDLEEEPSIEKDDVTLQEITLTTTPQAQTKKDGKAKSLPPSRRMNSKLSKSDDEEARIEKELAELYKDAPDYKSGEIEPLVTVKANTTTRTAMTSKSVKPTELVKVVKPIERSKHDFNFQPDINNKAEVERFRTSVDDITCDRIYTTEKLVGEITNVAQNSAAAAINLGLFSIFSVSIISIDY